MSEQLHVATILALLRTSGSPALTVHDGAVPDGGTPPYVLVYVHMEHPEGAAGNAVDGISRSAVARFYCHCVGGNAEAARALATRARAALLDVRPVIAGRVCGLIREEQALPPDKDETTGALVMDAIRVYRLRTDPA